MTSSFNRCFAITSLKIWKKEIFNNCDDDEDYGRWLDAWCACFGKLIESRPCVTGKSAVKRSVLSNPPPTFHYLSPFINFLSQTMTTVNNHRIVKNHSSSVGAIEVTGNERSTLKHVRKKGCHWCRIFGSCIYSCKQTPMKYKQTAITYEQTVMKYKQSSKRPQANTI